MENNEPSSTLSRVCESDLVESNTEAQNVEDNRILCTNGASLDRILKIAVEHANELADSKKMGDYKAQFVSRFTEVFINSMQENLSVNGMPWIVSKDNLSEVQREQQQAETNDAMLSKLSRDVEILARKRRRVPKECRRIYSMKLQQERQNLKKVVISHNVQMPSIPSTPTPVDLVTKDEFIEVYSNIESLQEQVQSQLNRLQEIQMNADIAKDIVQRNIPHCKNLSDTGYTSE